MSELDSELKANFESFRSDWTKQVQENWKELQKLQFFSESYRRLASLNALKNDIVIPNFSPDSAAFFFEAHNDALVSHVMASSGSWRGALQALRSCLENALNVIYYRDHPVELQLWLNGSSRLSFSELFNYMERHPKLSTFTTTENGLQLIKDEYSTLSRAVHGSAVNFRMTSGEPTVLLWSQEAARAGAWAAREIKVVEAITLVLAFLFAEKFTGAQLTGLKTMMRYSISASKRTVIKDKLGITVQTT